MSDLYANVVLEVKENVNGTIVGVQTGPVQGDFIEVKIYTFPAGGDRKELLTALLADRLPRPYKFLEPYTPTDREIFAGRREEIRQVRNSIIAREQLLVIYGAAGVGKTSLIAAGVVPELMESGALTIHIQDYVSPVAAIEKALKANAGALRVELPPNPTLPQLLGTIIKSTGGTLFLIFDQFELFFEPTVSDEQRDNFISGLAAARDPQNGFSKNLFIILLIRDDARAKLAGLQERIPGVWKCPMPLLALKREAAIEAIKVPLVKTHFPVSFVGDIVEKQIVPDLDALTKDDPKMVHPPFLQIVCQWLYDKAHAREPPHIDARLYVEEGERANGILGRYMRDTLSTKLSDIYKSAEALLVQMASEGVEHWVPPSRLQLKDVAAEESEEEVGRTLERLVKAELLVRRKDDEGQIVYAIAHPVIKDEARLLGGKDVVRRLQAQAEIERAWSAWQARRRLASREQLRDLAEFGTHLAPPAGQSLLLLRSATERDEPAHLWLKWLGSTEGHLLVSQLEGDVVVPSADDSLSASDVENAGRLLSLPTDGVALARRAAGAQTFGPVAQNAATHGNPAVRQASALALNVLGIGVAQSRLKEALKEGLGGWRLIRRRAELFGALADADPKVDLRNAKLSWFDLFSIWEWRATRRVYWSRRQLIWLTAGGALGAGLGLGIFRVLTAALFPGAQLSPNLAFGLYLYTGATLGAALSLGVALAGPLTEVAAPEVAEDGAARPRVVPPAKVNLLATILGAFIFGLTHIAITHLLGEWPIAKLTILMGFVAGAGLSAGLYPLLRKQPVKRFRLTAYLLIAALAMVLTQFTLLKYQESHPDDNQAGDSTAIVWPCDMYNAYCSTENTNCTSCSKSASVLDAAFAGLFLAGGTAFGLRLTYRALEK